MKSPVDRLMERLNTVSHCDEAAAKLVECGPEAIPALRRFLVEGRPGVVYQPRRAAVEALGELGAKNVLIEYLSARREIADPATRFAEESVRNAAARELAKFRTKDVLDVLLGFALPPPLPGVVEALSQFGSAEAIPVFLRALEGDLCQEAAMDGIRALGREAALALAASALSRLPSSDEERPSSLRRRAKALELLSEIGAPANTWPLVRPLLDEADPAIVAAAAKLAVSLGDHEDRTAASLRLLSVLPKADWFLREEIRDLLADLYPEAKAPIDHECTRRSAVPDAERARDMILRLLEGVRRRAGHIAREARER